MPQVIAAAAAWVGSTVMTAVGTTLTATGVTAAVGGATALGIAHGVAMFAYTVSEIALWAGMSYAVDTALKPKLKPPGSELQFNMDPAYPREMIIGQRLVGGTMVARYSHGSNLYNAHLVVQVADHPCVELSKVYDAGRVVRDTPLTHGTRTEITAYSNSGGARVWMTWWDGRPGQTADTDLITKSALDPDVVAGKLPGWSSDHVGAGCAYIHVEVQWDSDILTAIPQFTWLVKGAKLYDRRLDTTAGGSGSHRLDDPSTWAYSTNAAVAADHFLLGYKVEDDYLAFGIGLHPSEVPYDIFANAADLADEDVVTGTGDDEETIKRYVINGVVSAAEYFEDVLEAFQIQMAGRFVDLGGRIGFLGAEERDISLDLSDQDLTSDDQMQFADKLSFDDLYGSVSGTFADPANLYQQTPYDTQTTAYNALPDGGEAQQVQLALPYEIHPRRAVRNVSAWLKRESLQPRLVGVFMAAAWALEPGDWFTFTSERLQLDMAKFEVIDIAKNDDFTVLITARAIDPNFLAFSVDNDPDLSVPPDVEPASLVLDTPVFTPTATTISGGGATEPVIQVVITAPNPVTRELVIEAQEWNGSALTGPVLFFVGHADNLTSILRQGLKPATAYKVRMKARAGARESAWSEWSSAITMSSTYVVPLAGGATGDLSDDLSDIAADIAAADARLDDAEDTLDLHGTDIGTLETVTAGQATLITGLQARNTADQRASQNYLRNSTFYDSTEHWTLIGGGVRSAYTDHTYILFAPNVGHQRAYQDVRVEVGGVYSVGGELYRDSDNNARLYVEMLNEARDTSLGYPSIIDAPSTGWTRVNGDGFTAPSGAAWARIHVDNYDNGIGAYGTSGAGGAARRLTFTRSAVAQPWSEAADALPSFMENRASIVEVQTVNADQDSAIATLDSRLDAAESDIDGVESTASNLSTRMAAVDGGSASAQTLSAVKAELEGDIAGEASARSAAVTSLESADADHDSAIATLDSRLDAAESDVDGLESTASNHTTRLAAIDGGSASATSIAQLKAAYAFGGNECSDSEFRDYIAVWTNLYNVSGTQVSFSPFNYNFRRYLARYMTGMTIGHVFNVGQSSDYGIIVEPGDRIEASLYWGVENARVSLAHCFVDFYDVAGAYLSSISAGSGTSPYGRIGGFVTVPTGGYRACITGQLTASHAQPDAHIQGPVLRKASAQQTALSPYTRTTDPSTTARLAGAEASITEVESVNTDQDSAIASIDSRLDAAETDVDGLQSTASNLSTRMTAVDGGSATSTSIAQLVARNTADQKNAHNYLRNSTWLDNLEEWDLFGSSNPSRGSYLDHTYLVIPYGAHRGASQDVRVQPGVRYSVAGELYKDNTNNARLYVQWLNEAKDTSLGYMAVIDTPGSGWQFVKRDIADSVAVAPTGAVWARIFVDNYDNTAGYGSAGLSAARWITFTRSDYAQPWAEGDALIGIMETRASVTTVEEAIADEESARAAFQTTAEAEFDDINATVSTQGGAIADIEGGTAWLESVVAAGGGDLGAMRMRAGKAGSFLDLIFTVIRLANVSNGSVLEVMRAIDGFAYFSNPVSIDVGGKRMTLGPGFGVSSDLLFWFGPDTTDIDDMTKTNGHWAWATDGETYKGTAALVDATINEQTKTATASFDNVTTSGTTLHTMATIDLTVGASGYLELLSPLFFGPLSINAETGMTLSAGSDWFGQMIITEQLQSGGTEHTLWTVPLQISDTGGGLFDFIFDSPVVKVVAQNVSGASRYRIKLQRTSGSNNVSGNGLQGKFTIRRTP